MHEYLDTLIAILYAIHLFAFIFGAIIFMLSAIKYN